jgi:site-specific DNA-cytosine methylase
MNYLSVCSGVEAATVAWHDLGFKPIAFSEIEKFPSEVLKHHYPTIPNMGDMTKYKEWNLNEPINLLVGGTPCQSFSVAGLRKGLEDPRGNLALTYVGILDKFRPKWAVWENVPGVLSSNGGRDFGSFLGALAELGYGFAYRVLDAQYFGVPQRRRRVFVVSCLGDWESPAKVLFESSCLLRNPAPSKETRKETSGFTSSSFGGYGEGVGTIRAAGGDLGGGSETLVTFDRQSSGEYGTQEVASTVAARDYKSASDLVLNGRQMTESFGAFGKDISDTVTAKFAKGAELLQQGAQNGGNCVLQLYETHPADSRVKEMGNICQTVTSRWGTGGGNVPIAIQDTSGRDKAQNGKGWSDADVSYTVDTHATQGVALSFNHSQQSMMVGDDIASPLMSRDYKDPQTVLQAYSLREDAKANNFSATQLEVTPALQALRPSVQSHHAQTFVAQGFNVNARPDEMKLEDDLSGTLTSSQNAGILAVGFDSYNLNLTGDVGQTIKSPNGGVLESVGGVLQSVGVDVYNQCIDGDVAATLTKACGGSNTSGPKVLDSVAPTLTASNDPSRSPQSTEVTNQVAAVYAASMAVRRLTPIECERLQGFPDDYTNIPWRGKQESPDGSRYKAMGNSMAVPVMRWIGKRIKEVEG